MHNLKQNDISHNLGCKLYLAGHKFYMFAMYACVIFSKVIFSW